MSKEDCVCVGGGGREFRLAGHSWWKICSSLSFYYFNILHCLTKNSFKIKVKENLINFLQNSEMCNFPPLWTTMAWIIKTTLKQEEKKTNLWGKQPKNFKCFGFTIFLLNLYSSHFFPYLKAFTLLSSKNFHLPQSQCIIRTFKFNSYENIFSIRNITVNPSNISVFNLKLKWTEITVNTVIKQ